MEIGSVQWRRILSEGADILSVRTDPVAIDQMARHAEALMRWSRKINLTTIRDPLEVAVKHYLDSIVPVNWLIPGDSLLDIGTGGGFPGIPLKILLPGLTATLIDGNRKKIHFLKDVIRRLNLSGVEAVHGRAESMADGGRYDVIVTRAVSDLGTLLLLGEAHLAPAGKIIAWKGKRVEAEVDAVRSRPIPTPAGVWPGEDLFSFETRRYMLPFLGIERAVVVIRRRP